MADFTAKDVQALRQSTGAGMMDAKRALEATGGDAEAAARWLREQGLAKSAERSARANTQGAVAAASSSSGQAAALVELRSETDYVAKSPEFRQLAQELAQAVADEGEEALKRFDDRVDQLRITLKENINMGEVVRFETADGSVLDAYLHVQNDRGVNGVLVEVSGASREIAHEIALHVAFASPRWLSREQVPAELVEQERSVLETQSRNEGKPEAALAKIVEGRLNGWFRQHCLLEQAWVRDPKQSISQLLGGGRVVRYAQVRIGG